MNGLQRFFKAILPKKWGEAMEAESRAWMMQCPSCKREISVWDAGGIRYKGAGSPRGLGYCSQCGKYTWIRIYKKAASPPA